MAFERSSFDKIPITAATGTQQCWQWSHPVRGLGGHDLVLLSLEASLLPMSQCCTTPPGKEASRSLRVLYSVLDPQEDTCISCGVSQKGSLPKHLAQHSEGRCHGTKGNLQRVWLVKEHERPSRNKCCFCCHLPQRLTTALGIDGARLPSRVRVEDKDQPNRGPGRGPSRAQLFPAGRGGRAGPR